MSDVSESSEWTVQQSRVLASVTAGFTAFEEDDVLVAKITPCLENGKGVHARGLRNGIGFGSTEFHVLRAKPGNDSRFVFHVTQSRRFRHAAAGQMVGSAGQQRVQRQFFDEFLIQAFAFDEQVRIAKILDTLDIAIHETEAIIAKLKAIKQGLLHDLLTRGIAANGELRPPQSEAPHLYKLSPLGWIPKEWNAAIISDLAINLDGRRIPIKEGFRKAGEFPYYGASGVIDWVSSYLFEGDYVLLGEDGENVVSRHLPLAFRATGKIWVNNHAHIYEPKLEVDIRFLVELMEAKDYRPWISGSAQPKITQEALSRIWFVNPPSDEQTKIGLRLEKINSRIDSEVTELAKLKNSKTGLMDDLLTGRVRVTPLLAGATP
jgi:type I restriction enzyme S subunit